MNCENRRLREIQREKRFYMGLLEQSEKSSDCLVYQGKLDCLNREEKEILERYDVIV